MPGKSRRVASRQAQLSRQRRRQSRGPSGIPATRQGTAVGPQPSDGVDARVQGSVGSAPAAPRSSPPVPAGSGSARARAERSVTYNYIGTEFRRILILSGVVLAALIVLAILL
jgi:hypothetical protein